LAALGWFYRNWPQEHAVDKFFTALQQQHYEVAYGIYFNDPAGCNIEKNILSTRTPISIAIGAGRRVGLIKSHSIYGSANTKGLGAEAWWSKSSSTNAPNTPACSWRKRIRH